MQLFERLRNAVLAIFVVAAAISSSPAQAQSATAEGQAEMTYEKVWKLVSDRYYDSKFAGEDWTVWHHKFDGQLHTNEEAAQAIKEMLGSLHDPYTRVLNAAGTPDRPRQTSDAPALVTHTLAGDVGYIKISSFLSPSCPRDFTVALSELSQAKELVIDLRGNQGGLVVNALEIADMLLDKGDIVTTISRDDKHTYSCEGCPRTRQPIVVLSDEKTASASEILVAALKDNHRATIAGKKTFGKGLVQEDYSLPSGAVLRLTVARYVTPSGSDINKIGLAPDVEMAFGADLNAVLDAAPHLIGAHSAGQAEHLHG